MLAMELFPAIDDSFARARWADFICRCFFGRGNSDGISLPMVDCGTLLLGLRNLKVSNSMTRLQVSHLLAKKQGKASSLQTEHIASS